MKVIKVLFGIIAVFIIAVIIIASLVANNINDIVRTVVEDIGSEKLNTKVSLSKADISLMDSRVLLSGLRIDNPDGFSDARIFEMDNVIVDVELLSLLENTVSVKEILIDGAKITVEQKGTSTNVQKLLDDIEQGDETPATVEDAESPSSLDDLLVKVSQFQFVGSSAKLVTEQWGEQDLQLSEIKLKDIGGAKGVPVDELVGEIIRPIVKKLKLATEARLKEIFKEKAKEKLKEKTDVIKGKVTDKLNKALGEGGADKLKSLFSR